VTPIAGDAKLLNPATGDADLALMGMEGPANSGDNAAELGAGMISGSVTAVILRCVERAGGDDAVARLMALAEDDRNPAVLKQATAWTPYATVVALFRAGIEVTGNPDFARFVGEEMLRQYDGSEVNALFRSLGSPGEVMRNVALTSTKISTATALEAVEIGDEYAIVDAWAIAGLERDVTFCEYTAGVMTQTSGLFGMEPASVVETRCQRRGDARCRYEVRWDPSTSPELNPQRRIEHLESRLAVLTERFESMQRTTRELVSAEGVEHVLAKIAAQAAGAVSATGHLLAVRLGPGDLRLHAQGFGSEEEAQRVAEEILADEPDDRGGSRLIVDVTSGDRVFGRLAALYPAGVQFFPAERRLLEAYAATASAALNVATALEEARRQNETARTLLALASSLADASSVDVVAQRLAEAVPGVVGCNRATVLVWDRDRHHLAYRGITGVDDATATAMRGARVTPDDMPELERMIVSPAPTLVDIEYASPALRAVLERAGVPGACIVPLVARGDFYGVVTAPIPESIELTGHMWERLQGVASQGATALQNAQLLEQIRHQALHDALTGMPNRLLFEDRLAHALTTSKRSDSHVAVLFVDLDGFKHVNDTFGHACGDELLRQVARRVAGTVRASDTVARMGGDEFVVVLAPIDDLPAAAIVAEKVLDALRVPFDVGGHVLSISASVGVTLATDGDDPESLLNHADGAMYRAKSAGRNRVELAA
jgi:diguanylate cyclase (GGDEF)-like protein